MPQKAAELTSEEKIRRHEAFMDRLGARLGKKIIVTHVSGDDRSAAITEAVADEFRRSARRKVH